MATSSPLIKRNGPIPLGIVLIALTPAFIILLPWDFGPDSTDFRAFMRVSKLPATIVEFAFVLLAMLRGFSPTAALISLPRLVKVGLGMLTISIVWTTMFVAEMPIAAILGATKFFGHLMFGLALTHQWERWSPHQRDMIWPAIGFGVATFCLLWLVNIILYRPTGNDWVRLVPGLTTMRSAGPYALASFCAGIGFLHLDMDSRIRPNIAIAVLFGSLGLTLAFWTGTRASVVAIYIAVTFSSLWLPVRKQLAVLAVVSTIIGLAIALTLPSVHRAYGVIRLISDSIPAGDVSISSGRVNIWINMIDKLEYRPIMGWGIDQFRYSFPEGTHISRHPHNGMMQLLFSTGLWGLVAHVFLAISFIRHVPRKFSQPYEFASIAFIIGALFYGAYDGFFYFTYPIMIFVVAVVCVLSQIKAPPASDRSD